MDTRKYRSDERPKVGDVVKCFAGSFGDAVIVRSYTDRENLPMYDMERPHAAVRMGTLTVSIERIDCVTLKSVHENYEAYVTGGLGKIENRNY
jgi:hypothetical protein